MLHDRLRYDQKVVAMSNAKYRPSLSLPEIELIILAIGQLPATVSGAAGHSVIQKLKLLTFKADTGITQPAWTAKPRESIESKLGFSNETAPTPAQLRQAAYLLWQSNPAACSEVELERARHYKYDNNMLTDSEREEYETKYFGD
jgi:hypothetical protein